MQGFKTKILYKIIGGDILYVKDYTIAKLNDETILGGCLMTTQLCFAKPIPNSIMKDNILDKNIRIMYTDRQY